MSFEELLQMHRSALEAYVRFRVSSRADSEDIIQDIYLKGFQNFSQLKNPDLFKSWMLAIARNEVNDYYRHRHNDASLDTVAEWYPTADGHDRNGTDLVWETMNRMAEKDRRILHMYYWQQLSVEELARELNIPAGTCKSRLFKAREHFRQRYQKERGIMSTLPKIMPAYEIRKNDKQPFEVTWEELMGWFLVPREGNRLKFGIYDFPDRSLSVSYDLKCSGKAEVHGIEGVKVTAIEKEGRRKMERHFIAQLTDSHCRYLAESHMEDGVEEYYTFMDGDPFLNNWGFGEDNIGNDIHLKPHGKIVRDGNNVSCDPDCEIMDVVGRYEVTINGNTYDTVCLMDIGAYDDNTVSEQYIDANGRTVLWRRFNRRNVRWLFDRFEEVPAGQLDNSEYLTVNGETCYHWYDCITDYILD